MTNGSGNTHDSTVKQDQKAQAAEEKKKPEQK